MNGAQLTIVNGLARRALIRTSCLGQYFEKKAARAISKKFRRVTSVNALSRKLLSAVILAQYLQSV